MIPAFNNGEPYDGSHLIHRGAAEPAPLLIPWEGHSELQLLLDFAHTMSFRFDRIEGTRIRTPLWQFLGALQSANLGSRVVQDITLYHRHLSRVNAGMWL